MDDPLSYFHPPAVVESMDDPFLYFRPESDATVAADDGDHVSGDTAEQERILGAQAGSVRSTIEPLAVEALREELKKPQVVKDSVAAASALRGEMDSLSVLVAQIGAEFSRVQETARAALELGATVEQRLGAIESRLGPLGDLEDVRRETEKRFNALNALTQEVRASTDAVNRQRERIKQLAAETTAQLQQRKQRDVELGREGARTQSVQALMESAWRRAVRRSSLSLSGATNAAWRVQHKLSVAIGGLRRSLLSMHVAEAMANLRVPKAIGPIKIGPINYVVVVAVFTVLALISTFVLHSVWKTADLIGPPVVTAPVPSNAVPDLPSATSATTSSKGSLDSATRVRSFTTTAQAADVDDETPATRRATQFVGTLSIRSTPEKAVVHIDRERVGETPLTLRGFRAGSHAIWIEHEGYQRWTAGVNVRAEEVTRVAVTLQAEPGR